jgi:hypothetical protein
VVPSNTDIVVPEPAKLLTVPELLAGKVWVSLLRITVIASAPGAPAAPSVLLATITGVLHALS